MGIDKKFIISTLRDQKLITGHSIEFRPLKGGVSSYIYLLTDGERKYVIKQAREKLIVEDDWYADTSRNYTEQSFISYLKTFTPANVTDVLYSNQRSGFFVMEYLGQTYRNWKEQLLKGIFDTSTAVRAAELLAEIHTRSYLNKDTKNTFKTDENFKSLRIDPYLITAGNRHPDLKSIFYDEARRLENCKEALVHGDFSPKNIMIGPERVVLLDHEAAWFGDPSFDIAFLLNHLYLKMLYCYKTFETIPDLTQIAWNRYSSKMGSKRMQSLEPRTGSLLLMLMLARVDGKSPVEYLDNAAKDFIRSFVYEMLPAGVYSQDKINSNWKRKLNSHSI